MPIQKISEGKYRLWVSAGRGADGKRLRYSRVVEAKDDQAAERLYKQFEKEVLKDELPLPRNITFSQLWEMYLRDHVDLSTKPTTRQWYDECGKRIKEYFGYLRVSAIVPTNISSYLAALKDPKIKIADLPGGLSDETVRHHFRALRAVFNFAVKYKIIKDSPMDSISLPKAKKKPARPFYDDEISLILNALENEPLKWQLLCLIAITGGMRREELVGLKWSDIELDHCVIHINRAVQFTKNEGLLIDDTKTELSMRKVTMPSELMPLLEAWKKKQSKALANRFNRLKKAKVIENDVLKYLETLKIRMDNFNDEFVWNQYNGEPMLPRTVTHYWVDLRNKYNLPPVTFHGLRHTSATISIADGATIPSQSARLGHANASTTLKIYAHALESSDKQIANNWGIRISQINKWHTNGTFSEEDTKQPHEK